MELKRISVIVKGLVQGVNFRYFTNEVALKTGVSGWVRNLDNGDVQIEAQGNSSTRDFFLQQIHRGPRLSHVESVEVTQIIPVKSEKGFFIKC